MNLHRREAGKGAGVGGLRCGMLLLLLTSVNANLALTAMAN